MWRHWKGLEKKKKEKRSGGIRPEEDTQWRKGGGTIFDSTGGWDLIA